MNTELVKLMEYLSDKEVVTFELLEKQTKRTRRQLGYRLDKVNDFLKERSLEPLKTDKNKIWIPEGARRAFRQEALPREGRISRRGYAFEKEERIAYLYLSLFIRQQWEYLGTDYFAAKLQVSRTTIFADIKELRRLLSGKKIELFHDHEQGYFLSGQEIDIRNLLMELIVRLFSEKSDSLICNLLIQENHLITFEDTRKRIEGISLRHGVEFVEKRLDEFVYIFIFLYARIVSNDIALEGVSESIMTSFKEYRFTEELVRGLEAEECRKEETEEKCRVRMEDLLYITSWILGVSFGNVKEATKDYDIIAEFVRKTVSRFNAVSGHQQELTEEIFEQLYAHMRPAYYRLAFRLPVLNPLTRQIEQEFGELFSLVKETMRPFKLFFGREVPDSEIAYLTIHFACIYKIGENEPARASADAGEAPRALIVCSNGIGSSMILYNELTETFPDMYFYKPVSTGQLSSFEGKADIIFTTDPLIHTEQEGIPVIRVHPIISDSERSHLIHEVNRKWNRNMLDEVEELLSVIERHAQILDREELKNDLIIYQAERQRGQRPEPKEEGLHLMDLFRKEYIQLGREAGSWQEAVRVSYESFLAAEAVTENYVEKTIEAVVEKGPYIVIAKHIALAHSLPEDGARKNAMGLTVFRNPIVFGDPENDPVKYIFTLSIDGSQEHLAAMSELVGLLNDPYFWHIVDKTREPEAVLNYMKAVC